MDYTLTFDEKVKGWTSFHSYYPDKFVRLNNRFYTIKDGQLYLHNETLNGYVKFYGVQYKASIETIINDLRFDDSIFKTIILDGLQPWKVLVSTLNTNSVIEKTEFNKRGESRYFSYIRKNEDTTNLEGVAHGIGTIVSSNALTITFGSVNNLVSVGDELYQLNGTTQELIGIITDIANNVITVGAITTLPVDTYFCFGKKPSGIEGAEIRGYFLNIVLEDDSNTTNELFAVSSNAVKSYL